jgi:predicted DNA-binding transcriptional regulator AlpA
MQHHVNALKSLHKKAASGLPSRLSFVMVLLSREDRSMGRPVTRLVQVAVAEPPNEHLDDWLMTRHEQGAYLGVSYKTILRMEERGLLPPALKVGRRRRGQMKSVVDACVAKANGVA